jgi:hypothetical protein
VSGPVEIGRFVNAMEAHLALGALEAAGIEGDVFGENAGTMLPHIGGVNMRLVVRAEDAAAAAEVLREHESLRSRDAGVARSLHSSAALASTGAAVALVGAALLIAGFVAWKFDIGKDRSGRESFGYRQEHRWRRRPPHPLVVPGRNPAVPDLPPPDLR